MVRKLMAFAIALMLAVPLGVSSSVGAAPAADKGCWYTPPQEPGCHECSDTCNRDINQACCEIIIIVD